MSWFSLIDIRDAYCWFIDLLLCGLFRRVYGGFDLCLMYLMVVVTFEFDVVFDCWSW